MLNLQFLTSNPEYQNSKRIQSSSVKLKAQSVKLQLKA